MCLSGVASIDMVNLLTTFFIDVCLLLCLSRFASIDTETLFTNYHVCKRCLSLACWFDALVLHHSLPGLSLPCPIRDVFLLVSLSGIASIGTVTLFTTFLLHDFKLVCQSGITSIHIVTLFTMSIRDVFVGLLV